MPSAAQLYFDEIMASGDPYAYLATLPSRPEPVVEAEWLDFKAYHAGQEKNLQIAWSEVLCAFANTEGGVLIWGITANRGHSDKLDSVKGLAEVDGPHAWAEKLRAWLISATDPPVGGVRIETIKHVSDNRGFVVCLVPESTNKPHRAEFAKGKPYLLRYQDNNIIPSPSILRGLFHPRSSPRYTLRLTANYTPPDQRIQVRYLVELCNTGTATARETHCVAVTGTRDEWRHSLYGVSVDQTETGFTSRAEIPIHPGESLRIALCDTRRQALQLSLTVFSLDAGPQFGQTVIDVTKENVAEAQLIALSSVLGS